MEAIKHFSDPDVALSTMIELRWPNGVTCPECGRTDVRFIATRRTWECKGSHVRKQFTVKRGTIFEDSPLGLDKWFCAIWMIANCKNGVSSYEIHHALGVTQKTGWFMLHRIRLAMETGSFLKGPGTHEADETFIGGLAKNMHKARKEGDRYGRPPSWGGQGSHKVKAEHIPDTSWSSLTPLIYETAAKGSYLYTDEHKGYYVSN
jgi:transposase-like protein